MENSNSLINNSSTMINDALNLPEKVQLPDNVKLVLPGKLDIKLPQGLTVPQWNQGSNNTFSGNITSLMRQVTSGAEQNTLPETSTTLGSMPQLNMINLDIQTPFSLNDCYDGVGTLIESLEKVGKKEASIRQENVANALDSIMDYLRDRDDLHYTLINYQWVPLERIRAQQHQISRLWADSETRPKGITALSFEVEEADAVISNLQIKSQDGEIINNFSGDIVLRHSLPRRYVYHLYNPTDIYSLSFDVSKEKETVGTTPIITIQAGRADFVEHGKRALYYLIRAENELEAEKVDKAAATLRIAQGEIENFRKQSRR